MTHIWARSFPDAARDLNGLELEWLVVSGNGEESGHLVDAGALDDLILPGASTLSVEPGGQLELSSQPCADLATLCAGLSEEVGALGAMVAERRSRLLGMGLLAGRPAPRRLRTPRYDAMAEFFAADGPAGSTMMTSSAALQVNIGLGTGAQRQERWQRAHVLGPVLAAAFANSPLAGGCPTGRMSNRLAVWSAIDRGRTAPVWRPGAGLEAWPAYVLDARVMLIRRGAADFAALGEVDLSFGRWLAQGHELGYPTVEDLDYHLGTLFPPVRPKGWLELRYLDALPSPWWQVAAAVTIGLVRHPEAGDRAERAAAPFAHAWWLASLHGLGHPGLQRGAQACFDAASEVMGEIGAGVQVADAVAEYAERFVSRSRTPADDRLDAFNRTGLPFLAEDAHLLVGSAR
ncbi:MAG: glutamate-cysteine ligase family protein [Actinomycetota bacterium]|nr:glutamate-cysteine ligase family protein [Actinomycetota bacterium]